MAVRGQRPAAARSDRRSAQYDAPRLAWDDRWLLDTFSRLGHPAMGRIRTVNAGTAWEALERAGTAPDQVLETVLAMSHCERVDMTDVATSHGKHLDPAVAHRFGVVPIGLADGALILATMNPLRNNLEEDLAFATGMRVIVRVATPQEIRAAAERVYGGEDCKTGRARVTWLLSDRQQAMAAPTRGLAVEALDDVLADALDDGASDVHFEPWDDGILVRFRIDGVLHDIVTIPEAVTGPLISRLKVMAGLDIADRLRPQDGRASMLFEGRTVDVRVSTLPLGHREEKAVVRLLDRLGGVQAFPELGFRPGEAYRLEKLLNETEGLVLCTGPTGSGKTTTLYSAIRSVQSEGNNVITVEDPIEYKLEGINQVQIHEKSGLTFAAALRSILRQDPDVVLVGEIRDRETAGIAIKAAMTGRVVLSTLHTNDAPSAVARMIDIGADRLALATALRGVVAQRLVRRLCNDCAAPVRLDELPLEQQQLLSGRDASQLRVAVGCVACRQTGFRGRTVLAEVLVANADVSRAIVNAAEVHEITELARRNGMKTLWESGVERVLDGVTSLHELLDHVSNPLLTSEGLAEGVPDPQSAIDALLSGPIGKGADAGALPAAGSEHGPYGRILIVDDAPEERRALRLALERNGFQVLEAADGESAVSYARCLAPDAIVTELPLPRLDGIGLLQAVGRENGAPPVILYTRERDDALHQWARELGACEVVLKPADIGPLLKGVIAVT